ncbi:MAG: hypothetical protein PHH04_08920 [Thomasclavelia sp.]|nr:hypothetical protein [Thomasclavelia sp.]
MNNVSINLIKEYKRKKTILMIIFTIYLLADLIYYFNYVLSANRDSGYQVSSDIFLVFFLLIIGFGIVISIKNQLKNNILMKVKAEYLYQRCDVISYLKIIQDLLNSKYFQVDNLTYQHLITAAINLGDMQMLSYYLNNYPSLGLKDNSKLVSQFALLSEEDKEKNINWFFNQWTQTLNRWYIKFVINKKIKAANNFVKGSYYVDLYYYNHDYNNCMNVLNSLIITNKYNDMFVAYKKGRCLLKMGNKDEALKCFEYVEANANNLNIRNDSRKFIEKIKANS